MVCLRNSQSVQAKHPPFDTPIPTFQISKPQFTRRITGKVCRDVDNPSRANALFTLGCHGHEVFDVAVQQRPADFPIARPRRRLRDRGNPTRFNKVIALTIRHNPRRTPFSDIRRSAILFRSFFRPPTPSRPPDLNIDGNGVVMKEKLTTKQKRDRRWKIKRRKLRRLKTGL